MKYFNYIFICGYRAYLNKDSDPRFGALILVIGFLLGFFSVLLASSKLIYGTNGFIDFFADRILLFLGILALGGFLLYQYYSEIRINKIMEDFNKKSIAVRKLWGWITVFSILIPYTLTVVLAKLAS